MITNITLENFKCFRQVSINPKRLTVLIGPNGTGKSSVLQALLLLKQSVGAERLQYQGNSVIFPIDSDDAAIPNFATNNQSFAIGFGGEVAEDRYVIKYSYGTKFSRNGLLREQFGSVLSNIENYPVELVVPEGSRDSTGVFFKVGSVSAEFERTISIGRIVGERPQTGWSGTNPTPSVDVRNEAIGLAHIVSTTLDRLCNVPSVRGLVRPRYELGDSKFRDISLSDGLSQQEEQTASNLGYSRRLEDRLSELLKKITGTGLRAETVPPRSVEISSLAPSGPVNIVVEGFGANSLILLLHQLLSAQKGATVLIEEPEIHLHPKAQADLAQVLADTAKAEDKQIIMTTHSEYVAGRLLTLVAEGKLTTDELAIFYFEKDDKGECSATELEVTERGQVKGGLTGFHEATRDEMRRYVDGLRSTA